MHNNYNSCLHILDMHVEKGETSVFTEKTNSSYLYVVNKITMFICINCVPSTTNVYILLFFLPNDDSLVQR